MLHDASTELYLWAKHNHKIKQSRSVPLYVGFEIRHAKRRDQLWHAKRSGLADVQLSTMGCPLSFRANCLFASFLLECVASVHICLAFLAAGSIHRVNTAIDHSVTNSALSVQVSILFGVWWLLMLILNTLHALLELEAAKVEAVLEGEKLP